MDIRTDFEPHDCFYRHVPADGVDASGKPKKSTCQIKQLKEGMSCDWSKIRGPDETIYGTGHRQVLCINVQDCLSLGLTIRHCPSDDVHRPGQINEAHCEIDLPKGLTDENTIRRIRDELLKKASIITVG